MAAAAVSVRELVQAASAGIARVKRLDRLAGVVITLGGAAVVVSVLGILVFILAEAWPLFAPAAGRLAGVLSPARLAGSGGPRGERPLALGVDEYQLYVYGVRPDAQVAFFRLSGGTLAHEFPVPGLAGAAVTAASRSPQGDFVAAGTGDGRVSLMQVRFRPRYEEQKLVDLDVEVRDRGLVTIDAGRRPVREVSYREDAGQKAVAALVADDEIAVWRSGEAGEARRATLRTAGGEKVTQVRLGTTEGLIAGTDRGHVYHWTLVPDVRLTDVSPVSNRSITALEWALGGVSFVAGDAGGNVSAWFQARLRDDDEERPMVRAHTFPGQGSAVVAIGASSRDKSFVTASADGSLVLRHLTSERTLLRLPGTGGAASVLMTPKNDGIVVARDDGAVARYEIASPHPEVSATALFGPVWYEGYSRPEYVWQSTGATSDFEPKFSIVPLVFGTIKGTVYALLFAIPLAVLGALYTSQFVHPSVRQVVKPTIEVMAALPSVVIGFVAGLWLASLLERFIVPSLLMLVLMPLAGTAGFLLWTRLPRMAARSLKPGTEIALIVPLMVLGAWLAVALGPSLEARFFHGDFKLWLKGALDLTYDQRNCLVVGLAMGFAVIPIIFTISEDAFSSVPSHLTAASLALGASRWQTALRVVLPTASPGVFSAIMVGFGRAVGETMIVLMATGNTPVLDWSIFNGMRTLSANIAVEISEAPHGGTLYRVLFLAAGLLFAMTFAVNTVAELIRQRLRERYRAL